MSDAGVARKTDVMSEAVMREFDGERAYIVRAEDGTEAWVLPGIGANCVALSVPHASGARAHLLAPPPSAAALRGHPTGWGFPILFPHPGMHRSPFTWRGRHYDPGKAARTMQAGAGGAPGGGAGGAPGGGAGGAPGGGAGAAAAGTGEGRLPGHGYAAGAAWEVAEQAGDRLVCRLDARRLPAAAYWPWPVVLTVEHRVTPGALTLRFEIESVADEAAPLMFGLHPYFSLRFVLPKEQERSGHAEERERMSAVGQLARSVDREGERPPDAATLAGDEAAARRRCQVWVESDDLWLLKRGQAANASQAATGWQDLRRPRTIADLAEEAAQGGVAGPGGHPPLLYYARPAALEAMQRGATPDQPGGITSGVDDLSAGVRVRLEGSLAFGTVAAYFPERPSLSLEPRTALSDAIPLTSEDAAALTGLRALGPGEHWRAWAKVSCEALT